MTELEAEVKNVSLKTGGVLIGENWYNPEGSAKEYVKAELKGKKVLLKGDSLDQRKFSFIQLLSQTSFNKPVSEVKITPASNGNGRLGVTTGMAINNSCEWIKMRADPNKDMTAQEWAYIVCEHAQALLNEMESRGL